MKMKHQESARRSLPTACRKNLLCRGSAAASALLLTTVLSPQTRAAKDIRASS